MKKSALANEKKCACQCLVKNEVCYTIQSELFSILLEVLALLPS